MKRAGGLQRRTPIFGSPATHWAWQRRSQEAQRAKTRTQPSRAGESRARRLVRKRSGGLCEIAMSSMCTSQATEWSHRIRRSQGGLWLPSNGLAACRSCHLVITNTRGHRDAYVANGWVLNSTQRPLEARVLTIHSLDPVLLDDNGGWTPVTQQPTGEAA